MLGKLWMEQQNDDFVQLPTRSLFQGERTIDSLINELDELQLERLQAARQHKRDDNGHKRGKDGLRVKPIEEADSLDIENLKHLLKGLVSSGTGKSAIAASAPPVPKFSTSANKRDTRSEGGNRLDEGLGERLNADFAIDELPSIDSSILLTDEPSGQQLAGAMESLGKKAEQRQQRDEFRDFCMHQLRTITKLSQDQLVVDDLLNAKGDVDLSRLNDFQFWSVLFRRHSDRVKQIVEACDERCALMETQIALLTQHSQQQTVDMDERPSEVDLEVARRLAALDAVFTQ